LLSHHNDRVYLHRTPAPDVLADFVETTTHRAAKPETTFHPEDPSKLTHQKILDAVKEKGIANIEVVLASSNDSKLKPGTIDPIFIRNTFHDINDRGITFQSSNRY
jgi:hypothetical protein